jgi:hypothetical protein
MFPLFSALLLATMTAQSMPHDPATVHATQAQDPPRVDGLLDDPGWDAAVPVSGFRQREPREGAQATEATEIRVLYTRDTLYVGVLAHDREPDKVIARVLQRDRLMEAGGDGAFHFAGDDAIALILDPFGDRRNAFLFATNANGAEFDALITDERAAFNVDWRGVWQVAARRTTDGWSAEFAIPFRTLRYPRVSGATAWGFNVERIIRRRNEDTLWTAWSRAEGGLHRISQAGVIDGLQDLPRSPFNVELKPFGLGGVTQERVGGGNRTPAVGEWRYGADAKWEMRPGLVMDATLRPDFAQVEADQQIVNLTRFELFLPEKREFFLENAGIFEFGKRGTFETPPFLMFFSRRIGINGRGEVPVLGGVRLSGRAGKQTIGVMSVFTDDVDGEPQTNFGVLRVKRDVGRRGYLGAMLTDRRSSDRSQTDVGVDASFWPTNTLNVAGFAARTSASDGAADEAYGASAELQGDPWYAYGEFLEIGPDAQTGIGFVTRTDMRRGNTKLQYTIRPHVLGLRQIAVYTGGKYLTRVDGEEQDGNWFPGVSFVWDSGETVSVTDVHGFVKLDWAFDLAGRIPVAPARYDLHDTEISITSSAKRPLFVFGQASLLRLFGGSLNTLTGVVQVRGGSHLSLSGSYTRNDVDLPGGTFVAHVPGLRVTWTQSTKLSAAAYVQYESTSRRFTGNFRVNFIHRPGSDLYIVWNEERGDPTESWRLINRGLATKVTYLMRF